MAVKSVSIRIEEEMLNKISYIADYEGRSVNSQVLVLIRKSIKEFEDLNGNIDGSIIRLSISAVSNFTHKQYLKPLCRQKKACRLKQTHLL